MKILIATNSLISLKSHRRELFESIKNDPRFDVTICIPEHEFLDGKKHFGEEQELLPISLSRQGINPFKEISSIFSIIKVLRRSKPYILHNFTIKPVIYGSIAARFTNVPYVINSITGMGYVFTANTPKARILRFIITLLYRWISKPKNIYYIFQNQQDQEAFIKSGIIDKDRCVYIPGSGVNIDRFTPSPTHNEIPKIFFAGRLLREKGIYELLEALANISAKQIPFEALIAGDIDPGNPGSLNNSELEKIKALPHIRYLGFRNDLDVIFREIDIACLPSYREGMPMFLLEALASGKPIVTTNAPGCSEIIDSDKNGYLIPIKDSFALQAALENLLTSKSLRETMGVYSRSLAESKFSSIAINQKIRDLYASLAKAES